MLGLAPICVRRDVLPSACAGTSSPTSACAPQDVDITTQGGSRASKGGEGDRWSGLNMNGHRGVWSEYGSSNRFDRWAG